MNSSTAAALDTEKIWLRSREWDMLWITGSAVLVAFLILMYSFFKTDQSYYTVVLSFLLLHYYLDHFLFFSKEDELKPALAPARA
ncbi:MAG: hypothetical protein ACRECJ_04900 [Limisphaerales bacterium]